MDSPIPPNTRSRRGRRRTQPGSVPSPGPSTRGIAYRTQSPANPMTGFSTHLPAQVEPSNNQILSGDSMNDGDGGAESNPSPQAQLTANYLNDLWAAIQTMIRERPQDVKQLEGGALWVPNNENFLKNLEPRKLKMDTLRKYMGDLGYQKKRAKKSENSSLWVPKKAPQHSHSAQQTEPTTAVTQFDRLQKQFDRLQKQFEESQNEVKELRGQLNELKECLVPQHGRAAAEPVCANCGSSQVARNTPQTNHGDIHGTIPEGGPYGVDAPPEVPETRPPYNQADPIAPPQPYGDGFDPNPGIGQSYPGEYMTPGATTAQFSAMQNNSTMSQGAGPSSGQHQGSTFAAGAGDDFQYDFTLSSPQPFPTPTRAPPGHYYGGAAGRRVSAPMDYVPLIDPNAPNQNLPAGYAPYPYRSW